MGDDWGEGRWVFGYLFADSERTEPGRSGWHERWYLFELPHADFELALELAFDVLRAGAWSGEPKLRWAQLLFQRSYGHHDAYDFWWASKRTTSELLAATQPTDVFVRQPTYPHRDA